MKKRAYNKKKNLFFKMVVENHNYYKLPQVYSLICRFCGKRFFHKQKKTQFCSPYCRYTSINKQKRINHYLKGGNPIFTKEMRFKLIICKYCKRPFLYRLHQSSPKRCYGSKECQRKHYKERKREKRKSERKLLKFIDLMFNLDDYFLMLNKMM